MTLEAYFLNSGAWIYLIISLGASRATSFEKDVAVELKYG